MANALLATQVAMPQVDTGAQFGAGVQGAQNMQINAQNLDTAKQQQYMQGLNTIAAGAAYATDPKTGQVDPAKWNEVVDSVAASGADVAQFRDHPNLAPMLIKLSLSTADQMKLAQSDADLEMRVKEFGLKVAEAMKGPDPTTDQREYQQAVEQGFKGTLMDYQQAMKKAGAQTINVGPTGIDYGDPGSGYVWQRDPTTNAIVVDDRGAPIAIPFQGGKPYQEQQAATTKQDTAQTSKEIKGGIAVEDIDRSLAIVKKDPFFTTGLLGQMLQNVGGLNANNLKELGTSIRANVGFDQLQQMREASPTGGALGQVSDNENKLLQGVLGSIEQSQTSDQLTYNLKRLKNTILDIVHGQGNGPKREDLGDGVQQPSDTPAGGDSVDWTVYF